jgi:hypothetical protein
MREPYEFDYVNGLRVIRLPENSPVITMEHLKAVQEAIDDEDAANAFCTTFPETSL